VRFLSEQPNVSERCCAGSLYAVLSAYLTIYQEQAVEKVVLNNRQMRCDTADCRCLVFEVTCSAQDGCAQRYLTVEDLGRAAPGVSQSMAADRDRRTSWELHRQAPDGGPFDDDEIARYATSAE
jgi:hypothetical protein